MQLRPLIVLARYFPKVEEWLMSAIPSSLSYEPVFKEKLGLGDGERITCVAVLAILFAGVLAANRVQKRRKALAEVLATSYHINFVEHLDRVLSTKEEVVVNGSSYRIEELRFTLPRNTAELRGHLRTQGQLVAQGRLHKDVLYGGRTVNVRINGNKAIVHDWPRTLDSLGEYLTEEGDTDPSGDVPAKYYRWFSKHLRRLKARRVGRYEQITYMNINGQALA
jgi:hypothetical protein